MWCNCMYVQCNVMCFDLIFDLCCMDATVWRQQIVEMLPSWHLVTKFYVCLSVCMCNVMWCVWFNFWPLLYGRNHPSMYVCLCVCAMQCDMFWFNLLDLCCMDATVWRKQIVEMLPSWHLVTKFYEFYLCVMMCLIF